MASIYRRGATWWISYTEAGRRRQRSLDTDNQRVAEHLKKKLEVDLERGVSVTPTRTPIPELIESFLRHRQAELQGLSRKSYLGDVSRLRTVFGPITPTLELPACARKSKKKGGRKSERGSTPLAAQHLEDITPEMVRQYLGDRMLEDGVSATTANADREILHRLFQFAIDGGNYRPVNPAVPNPVAKVKRAKDRERTIRYLRPHQVQEQLDLLAPHPQIQAMVAVLIFAGPRREEVMWLTREDVDLERGVIHIRAKSVDGEPWAPKTRRNRIVPISTQLRMYLEAYSPPAGCVWFFPSPEGCRYDPDHFSRDLRELQKAADLPWGCLDFRHTFGSLLAQKGLSLLKIARLMGNTYQVAERHYAALVPEEIDVDFDLATNDAPASNVIQFRAPG